MLPTCVPATTRTPAAAVDPCTRHPPLSKCEPGPGAWSQVNHSSDQCTLCTQRPRAHLLRLLLPAVSLALPPSLPLRRSIPESWWSLSFLSGDPLRVSVRLLPAACLPLPGVGGGPRRQLFWVDDCSLLLTPPGVDVEHTLCSFLFISYSRDSVLILFF